MLIKRALKRVAARIPPEAMERALAHSRFRRMKREFAGARLCVSREQLWDYAISSMAADSPAVFLEFGVFRGYSISYFADRLRHPDSRFVGFDSFEGLPESWVGYVPGTFSTAGQMPRGDDPRVTFVKGWFQDTVPGFLRASKDLVDNRGPVLVHFDADLFSSTLFLLTTLWHSLPSYYFMFDEFMGHELRAWCAFREAYPVAATFLGYDMQDGFPCRVFGSLQRVPAQPVQAA
jgi:Macrocin-O-methyltransferase (TylF)